MKASNMFLEIKGKTFLHLIPGQMYLLGDEKHDLVRGEPSFISLEEDEDVCKRHCIIEITHNNETFVIDLFSLNGTFLNNKKLKSLERTPFQKEDTLKVGSHEILFHPTDVCRDSLSNSNRQSDSFAIPDTQYPRPRNSLNGSNLSVPESIPDNAGTIKFKFGDLDSFEGDDLCIPETQEILPTEIGNKFNENSTLEEEVPSNESKVEGSQFRICTQDYNEGFGDESVHHLQSQIIPFITHKAPISNITAKSSDNSSIARENDITALKLPNTKDNETTAVRMDCLTPDIFDFDVLEADTNKEDTKKADKTSNDFTGQKLNLQEEDEQDILPTQVLPPDLCVTKVAKKSFLDVQDKPCLEIEKEEVITSSDKENKRPVRLEEPADLPLTQLFEVPSARTSVSHLENIKFNSLLNNDADEEDNMLTQAFLQPPTLHNISTSSVSKDTANKYLNSTFLDEKVISKTPVTLFAESVKTPLKTYSAKKFKLPDKNLGVLKKTSSATSATSENDIDLLMCTPQLIKDNIFLGKSEDLEKNILAVKNRILFGGETEDEDDDQHTLVKLINVPKDSLDFDKLLPHLNRNTEGINVNDEQKSSKEKSKIHKFNIFEKDLQPNPTTFKSSTLMRDERHEARDKEKDRKTRSRKNEEKSGVSQRKGKQEIKENDKDSVMVKKQERLTRARKRLKSSDNNENDKKKITENKIQMPPRRMTRMWSTMQESPQLEKEQNKTTEPSTNVARTRTKSKQKDTGESPTSSTSSVHRGKTESKNSNVNTRTKKTGRKRKIEEPPAEAPSKVERKSLRSQHSSITPVSISITMVDQALLIKLLKNSNGLWNIAVNCTDCQILVMDKPYRTFKFLLAMARGIPIVTSDYLKKINETKSVKDVQINDHLFRDPEFEKKHRFSLSESYRAAKENMIFVGYEFLTTASILPNPQEIKTLIEISGGYVHEKTPPPPKENQKLYLVTTKEDKKDWHKYRRLNKNIIIISTEAIMSAVMSRNSERIKSFTLA